MKKAFTILIFLVLSLNIFATATIIVPEKDEEHFILLSGKEMLPLDDYVWYKKWNGLLAQQLDEGIYIITENSHSVVVAEKDTEPETIERAIRFEYADSLILLGSSYPDAEELKDSGIRNLLLTRRVSEVERRILSKEGITVSSIREGDVIDFESGKPVLEDGKTPISVICPDCGTRFVIYI